jgi:NodT family efflux transporter outer membrane factor (OMF) lipoprotein
VKESKALKKALPKVDLMNHKFYSANLLTALFVLCCCVLVSGCISVGPDYTAPELYAPNFTIQGLAVDDNATDDVQKLADWWNGFGDEMLVGFVVRALDGSLDMHAAIARVQAARAELGISRSDFFPKVDSAADFTRIKIGKDAGGAGYTNMYRAGFDASWEIDFFGANRRTVEAANAQLESEIADLHDVWISLAAETALNYIEIRTFQRRLQVARKNLKAQEETLAILSSRYTAGLTDALDVSQARYNMESTRSAIPLLQTGIESSLNALAVLIGQQPGSLHDCFDSTKPIPVPPSSDIIGINADVLRRRPDIRRAERRLAAESARIGEAVAMLYPKFSLAGFFGTQSMSSAELFTSGAGTHSIVPGIMWPVFRAGELVNRIRAQTAVKDQYLATYEKTVLSAVAEVRDALSGYVHESRRITFLQNAVKAAGEAVDIAQDKYRNGLTDFNNVLIAQRSLLSLEENLAISQGNTSGYMVKIYKALGGGWAVFNSDSVAQSATN